MQKSIVGNPQSVPLLTQTDCRFSTIVETKEHFQNQTFSGATIGIRKQMECKYETLIKSNVITTIIHDTYIVNKKHQR